MTIYIASIIIFFILSITGALVQSIALISASFLVMIAVFIINRIIFSKSNDLQKKNSKSNNAESVLKKLNKLQKKAKAKGDWRVAQKLSLEILWVRCNIYKTTALKNTAPPVKLDSNNTIHRNFANQITLDLRKLLADDNKYRKCLYVPQSYLDYPVDYTDKALKFYINLPDIDISEKNICEINRIALKRFIDIDEKELPSEVMENMKYVKSVRKQ